MSKIGAYIINAEDMDAIDYSEEKEAYEENGTGQ